MNRRITAVLLIVAVVAIAGLLAGCGNNAPAKVGKVSISNKDFETQLEGYAAQYGITNENAPDIYQGLAADVLESLIAAELAVQKAPDLGITLTDEEVQEQVDLIVADYYGGDEDALVNELKADSMSMDDLREEIRGYILSGLVAEEIVKDADEPTDEEIAAYYEENKSQFLTEEIIEARHILVGAGGNVVRGLATTTTTESTTTTTVASAETPEESTSTASTTAAASTTTTLPELDWAQALATAAEIRVDLLTGGSWSRLAARYSDDLDTKDYGGYLGAVVFDGVLSENLGLEFENALLSLDLDQISEPIRTEHGYELIQIIKITEPQEKTLEEAKAEIADILKGMAEDELWLAFIEEAKAEIGVTYRDDMRPTTTTTEQVTTTLAP